MSVEFTMLTIFGAINYRKVIQRSIIDMDITLVWDYNNIIEKTV